MPASRRIAHAILFATLMLATMEFAARLDDHVRYDAPMVGSYEFDRLFSFDGKVVRGIPGARYKRWALNQLGLRGPEVDTTHEHDRVVVYGASEVFGIYETPDNEFPRALERELKSRLPDRAIEVANAGIPGMRIGSGAEYLRTLGEVLKPSVVVLYPTPTHYIGTTHPNCGRAERAPGKPDDGGLFHARLVDKAVERLKEVLPRPLMTLGRQMSIAWTTRKASVISSVDEASLTAMAADLKCAIRAVRDIGAKPVLLTHANRFASTPQPDDTYWLIGWRNQYPEALPAVLLDLERRANEVIGAIAQEEQVTLLDAAAAIGGQPQLFADHAHFNDEGAKSMSRLLADGLTPILNVNGGNR